MSGRAAERGRTAVPRRAGQLPDERVAQPRLELVDGRGEGA